MKNNFLSSHPTTLFLLEAVKKRFTKAMRFLFIIALQLMAGKATAQLSLTSSSAVTINFDAMGTGATATVPTGIKVGSGSATTFAAAGTATAQASTTPSSGASGAIYNFGSASTTSDRCVGFIGSGSYTPGNVYLAVTNNTGATLSGFTLTWNFEKYRSGSRAWNWTFAAATTDAAASYADPVSGAGAQSYAADANNTTTYSTPPSISKSVTISGLSLGAGATYYIRWTFTGVGGTSNGQGIGIDNIVITPVTATCSGSPAAGTTSAATTNICTSGTSVLSVAGGASGGGISYQWQSSSDSSSWTDISGATASGYTSSTLTSTTFFRRRTTCTPSTTTTNSNGAKVSVTSITSSPSTTTIAAGSGTTFTVSATAPASYQWQRSTTGTGGTYVNITSATFDATGTYSGYTTTSTSTSNTLTLSGVPASWNGYAYRCVVTNTCGNVTSAGATLNVTSSACSGMPATGTATPVAGNLCTSGSTTINLTAYTAGTDVTYQWQSSADSTSWTDISGATDLACVTPTITATTYFRCNTTCGTSSLTNISNTATVTVTSIVTGPSSVSIAPTTGATFTAIAAGGASYQWQRSTTGTGGTYVNITSATMDAMGTYSGYTTTGGSDTNTLTLASVPSSWNNYAYRCVVTNTCGNVTSGAATLNVECSGTPATGTATAAVTAFCGSGSTTVSLTGYSFGAGVVFQWESSSDSATWNPISGATNAVYLTGTVSSTKYYHCISTCNYSGLTNASNNVTVRINAMPTIAVTPAGGDVCSGTGGLAMTASGASTYTWAPATGLSSTTGATKTANPTVNVTYTITGTSAAGCVGTTTVTATYRMAPAALTVSPTSMTLCPGAAPQRITVAGGTSGPSTTASGSISVTVNGGSHTISSHSITVAGIPSGAVITGASVNFNASMPWQDDFMVHLAAPNGKILNLENARGLHSSGTSSFSNTTVSSSSTNAWPAGSSTIPASTTYMADATNGIPNYTGATLVSNVTDWNSLFSVPNGTWQLIFHQYSTFANANGSLTSWSLTLNYSYRGVTWTTATRLFTDAAGTVAYAGSLSDTVYAVADTASSVIIYTATSSNGSCSSSAYDTVTVNPLPTISGTFSLSPATACPGTSVSLNFSGTTSGAGAGAFARYNWTGPGGYSGTSAAPATTFTPTSSSMSGTYSVTASYSNPGCTSVPVLSSSPLNVASPAAYNVTGGFGCATSGLTIGLSNTEASTVSYQLYLGATPTGSPITGTGTAISFGSFTSPGTYTVYADNGSCAQFMNDSAVIYDTIVQYNITGGGVAGASGCSAVGLVIGLSSSQLGVSYQLYNGSTATGSPVAGTGAAIAFNGGAAITAAGTYSVRGTIGSCTQTMNGSSIIYSSLNTYTVTGGTGCTTPGLAIGLSSSDFGASYQLYKYGVTSGSPVTGTGSSIAFGTVTSMGVYSVQATVGGGCSQSMTGNAIVYGAPSFTISPSVSAICAAPGQLLTVTPGASPLTVLSESFDGTIASGGWTTDYTVVPWVQTTGSTYSFASSSITSSGKFYVLYDGTSVNTSSHIVSPSFSLVGLASATLTFHSFFDLGSTETAGADISTNGGSTWTSIFSATNNWSGSGAYTINNATYLRTVSLNAYVGNSDVKIRFRYDKASAGTSYAFAVDNPTVFGTPASSAYTWTPAEGLSATTGLTSTATPTVSTVYSVSVSGCNAGTASVRVDALPTAGTVAVSATNICLGSGASFVLSESGTPSGPTGATLTSYAWNGPGSYVSTATAATVGSRTITPSTPTAGGIYSLVVTYNEPGCTSMPVLSPSVTVDYLPGIAIGANPSVCQPITSTSISYSSPSGSPTTYSLSWDTAAAATGFTDVTSASLPASVFTIPIPGGAAGAFHGVITVANANCTSNSYPITVTVYAYPTAAITSAPSLCSGYATNIIFTGTSGAVVAYTVDSGSTMNGTLTGGTYTLGTGVLTSAHTYRLLNAHNPVCSTTIDTTITINPIVMQWVGGTTGHETNWNTAANWSCGFVPGAGDNVTINAGTTYTPTVDSADSVSVKNLTVASAATVVLRRASVLGVKGDLSNDGSVTGSGILSLNESTAQSIAGRGSVSNFDLNNIAGATVTAGSLLTIKSTLSVTSGTLNTGDSVVLYSDATASARVAELPPSGSLINGTVKVMQYVPGGRRAYRFWSHPFSNPISLGQVQNYIDVTGVGGSGSGFTTTASNAPSAFWYHTALGNSSLSADPGWKAFTSTYPTIDTNRVHQHQGVRLFFRGTKGEGLYYASSYTPSPVTVAQWGTLNQGTQVVSLAKGAANPYQQYNMVGNPYASPVDIGTVVHNALVAGNVVGPAFFVWNPSVGTAGQYVANFINTTSATPYYIQACNSFQVCAAFNGSTLTFNEGNKGNAPNYDLFKTDPKYVTLNIYDANYHLYDMLHLQFNSAATDGKDYQLDAVKPFGGADVNFYSLSADSDRLIVDARPYDESKVIPLGLKSGYQQEYIFKAETLAIPQGGSLYLHDKLLKQYVLLQPGSEYRFSVNGNASSQGDNRFELAAKPQEAPQQRSKGLDVSIAPNPATDEVSISYSLPESEEVTVKMTDVSGVCVFSKDMGVQTRGSMILPLVNYAPGIYMIELTAGSQKTVQRLVKE